MYNVYPLPLNLIDYKYKIYGIKSSMCVNLPFCGGMDPKIFDHKRQEQTFKAHLRHKKGV